MAAETSRLKNGQAAGICRISAELLKAGGEVGIGWLTHVVIYMIFKAMVDWHNCALQNGSDQFIQTSYDNFNYKVEAT